MRWNKLTDGDDWNIKTFFHMAKDIGCWSYEFYWKEWRLSFRYIWHDGPIFQLCLGPLYVFLCYQ